MRDAWHNDPDPIQERYEKTVGASKNAVFVRRSFVLLIAGLLVLCCACSLVAYLEWVKPLLVH